MADFRRLLYVFAAVAFLVSLTVPAYADFNCSGTSDNRPVRSESFDDLAGNIVLTCTGGSAGALQPTTALAVIPPTTITVTTNTNITSRIVQSLTAGVKTQFNEALLIIDEPNTTTPAGGNGHVMSNCGFNGEDSDPAAGPGVCQMVGVGAALSASQYDGLYTGCDSGVYGCGHPNVYQGRQAVALVGGEFGKIQFVGVPLDPPATNGTRVLRFANIRIDSTHFGVASPFSTVPVTATVSFAGFINVPDVTVQFATVELGITSTVYDGLGFLQCIGTDQEFDVDSVAGDEPNSSANPFFTGSSGISPSGSPSPTSSMDIRVIENFSTAWRTRNVGLMLLNGTDVGGALVCSTALSAPCDSSNVADGAADTSDYHEPVPGWTQTDTVQNVPGVNYQTEAGFENQPTNSTPGTNPPPGFGSPVSNLFNPFENNGPNTGFKNVGVASQGTRISIQVGNIPNGAQLFFPINVLLQNQSDASVTGVMVADAGADQNGFTSFVAGSAALFTAAVPTAFSFTDSNGGSPTTVTNTHWVQVTASTPVITYEMLFTRADALEYVDIVPAVVYNNNNLPTDLPQAGVSATATVSLSPIQGGLTNANQPQKDGIYSTPRFIGEFKTPPDPLFAIDKCACNLLFPWVVSAGTIDTGIVVANTSLDPCAGTSPCPVPGFGTAAPQVGTVTFYYFGTVGVGDHNPVANLAPNTSLSVPAGGYVAHVLSQNTTATNGLGSRTNFAGYVIAQANFQWCHGVVDITQGAGVIFNYVGLELDNALLHRTNVPGEVLGH